jgi:serine-type D-Ala-D-Ala carboxypeptidase/endopeptidase
MPDTRIELTADQKKRFAAPYDANGKLSSTWEFDAIAGAGALRSTADDMLTYLQANMGFKKSDLLPAMHLSHEPRHDAGNKTQSIGLGWHIEKWPHDSRLFFHGGGTGGYNCLVGFMEQESKPTIAIVVLSNAAPAPTGMVANDVGVKVVRLLTTD